MEIVESKSNGILILSFKGRLDAHTSSAAQEKLLSLIDQGETRLIADLSQLDYISSAGLHVFMTAAKRLKVSQGKIVLCSLSEPIKEVFDIAGVSAIFPIHPGREEALGAFR